MMRNLKFLSLAIIAVISTNLYAQSRVMPDSFRTPKVSFYKDRKWNELFTKPSWTGGKSPTDPIEVKLPEGINANTLIKVDLTVNNKHPHILILNTASFDGSDHNNFKPKKSFSVGNHSIKRNSVQFYLKDACPEKKCDFKEPVTVLFYLYERADAFGRPYLPESQIGTYYTFK